MPISWKGLTNKFRGFIGTLCFILLVYSATMFFFGRGLVPIVGGIAGIIASMEGYYASRNGQLNALRGFMWFLLINASASTLFGYFILSRFTAEETQCAGTEDQYDRCLNTFKLYGYIYGLFGGILNFITLLAVGLRYRQIRSDNFRNQKGGWCCCGDF